MKGNRATFYLLSAGMEICWLYAMGAFFAKVVSLKPFGILWGVAIFFFASFITSITRNRGLRVIYILILHLLSFSFSTLLTLHNTLYPLEPILGFTGLFSIFFLEKRMDKWLHLIFIVIWVSLYWFSGVAFSRRKLDYYSICARFDIGITAFFCIYLTKLVLETKGGIKGDDEVSSLMVFPFFLLSLPAIGIAREEDHVEQKDYISGYRGIAIMMAFVSTVLLISITFTSIFLPLMKDAASYTAEGATFGARLIFPVFKYFLLFMFGKSKIRSDPEVHSDKTQKSLPPYHSENPWLQWIETILFWGIKVLFFLLFFIMATFFIYLLMWWLFSKTEEKKRVMVKKSSFFGIMFLLRDVLEGIIDRFMSLCRGYKTLSDVYRGLLSFVGKAGIRIHPGDTPFDIALKVERYFPELRHEIALIVHTFCEEIYGGKKIGKSDLSSVISAIKRIKTPLKWPKLLKIRLSIGKKSHSLKEKFDSKENIL
ncbi:MAG: DUF4129 domain-containing protein [Syntrophorhabdaceae bacterium]|nr:DUF4129 domain-containing protein [Syntrophorhabdaceae bacterium]